MNANATIAQLYYLIITADGKIDEREIEMGKLLVKMEGLNDELFRKEMDRLTDGNIDVIQIIDECLSVLEKLEMRLQIRYMAWVCVIANSDGFMDKKEWELVYKLYSGVLNLPMDRIMIEQKEILMELSNHEIKVA